MANGQAVPRSLNNLRSEAYKGNPVEAHAMHEGAVTTPSAEECEAILTSISYNPDMREQGWHGAKEVYDRLFVPISSDFLLVSERRRPGKQLALVIQISNLNLRTVYASFPQHNVKLYPVCSKTTREICPAGWMTVDLVCATAEIQSKRRSENAMSTRLTSRVWRVLRLWLLRISDGDERSTTDRQPTVPSGGRKFHGRQMYLQRPGGHSIMKASKRRARGPD